MYVLEPSIATSILFAETGCMVRGEDLADSEIEKIGFLIYGEETGDLNFDEFNLGMVLVCNIIMQRVGFLTRGFTLEDMYSHRRNMRISQN